MQIDAKTAGELIEWNGTAPLLFFKAATDPIGRTEIYRDFYEPELIKGAWQKSKFYLVSAAILMLTAMARIVCYGGPTCCRRMKKAGTRRIQQRVHINRGMHSWKLKHLMCRYLLIWHFLGAEAMGGYPGKEASLSSTEESSQILTEEEYLQMNIQPTFGSRHAAIVTWTHPGEYRFSRRGIGHAIVIDKHKSHTRQIQKDFQEFEDMEERKWTRSERKIQWGSISRFHWMIHNGPRTPIWAYIHENERSIFWTMLLDESRHQWTVSDLFEQIMPEHQCRQEAECHINGMTWDQVVQISPGRVLDMTHIIPRSENEDNHTPSTMTCSEAMQSYSSAPSRAQEDDDSSSLHQIKNAQMNQRDSAKQKKESNEERRQDEDESLQQHFEEEQRREQVQGKCTNFDGYRQHEDLRIARQLIQEAEREWDEIREYTDDHTEMNNGHELQAEIAALSQGEDAMLHLVMHGLSTYSIGTREKHVDPLRIPMMIDLLIAIREAWRDQLRAHSMMTVSYVKPQPRVTTDYGTQCIHLVIDVEPWIFGTPNLLMTSHRYAIFDAGAHAMKAYRETQRISKWSVMARSNTIETCEDEHNLCNFWAGGSLLDQQEIASYHGMLVSVDIAYGLWQWNIEQEMDQALDVTTQQEEEIQMEGQEEEDETMWTQVRLRSASRSPPPSHSRRHGTSRFREAHIFEENRGVPDKIPMDQVPQDMVKEHIEEQLRHQRGDTAMTRAELFEIHPNPPTIINKNAIGFIWRPLIRQQMHKVIILLDIDVIPYATIPNVEAVSYRNAVHVRQSSTRAEMLQEVGIEAMEHEEECVVITRGSLWEEDDVSTRHHENGDYFLISAAHKPQRRSPREVLTDLIEWQNNRERGCDLRTARRRIERPESDSDNSDLLQTSVSPQRKQMQDTREEKEKWQENEGDTFSGMATNRAARRHTHARVYTMDDEEHQIIVPIPRIPESQFRAHIYVTVTEGYTAHQRAAFCLHQVVPNPDDRESKKEKAYILEDDTQKPPEMIPILLDVNVVTNQPRGMGPTDEWRETKYISQRLTRRQFINEVQLGPWCDRGTCIIQMGGRLWRTNDADTWALFPGIYAIITVLNEQCDIPFHIQWRRYNGPHQEAERSHTSSSPSESNQEGGNREQGESSPSQVMGSDPESDMNDLMQRTIWQVPRNPQMQHHVQMNRTSAARAAAAKLPPPGNGVRFQQCTTIVQGDGRTLVNDCSMTNRYIEEFCTTRDGCDNKTFKAFIHECRFQQLQNEKQDQGSNNEGNTVAEDTNINEAHLPISEGNSARDDIEQEWQGKGRQKLNLYQCLYEVCRDANPRGLGESNGRMSKQETMEECISNMRDDPRAKYVLNNQWDEIPQLHHTTRQALAQTMVRTQGELHCVHIYVDGSRTKNGAAWAMVVELETCSNGSYRHHLVGYTGAKVVLDPDDPFHIGEDEETAIQAEAVAMTWAHLWIMAWEPGNRMKFHIHGDSLAILNAANGSWQIPTRHTKGNKVMERCQCIAQRMIEEKTEVTISHSKAHAGIPANEAADAIARAIADNKMVIPERRSTWTKQILEAENLEYIWWTQMKEGMPPPWQWQQESEKEKHGGFCLEGDEQGEEKENIETFQIKIASANVFSSLDQSAKSMVDRRQCISQQAKDQGWSIIGLQETRVRQSILKSDPFFHMITTKATDRGHDGTEIWFSKEKVKGRPSFQKENLHVIHQEPSILAVAAQGTGFNADVISAHAPQRTDEKREEWWKRLEKLIITRQQKGRSVILMADCNARLGSVESLSLGDMATEEECLNGERMRQMMEDLQLFALNTSTSLHTGTSFTYKKSRIDYIITTTDWKAVAVNTHVDEEFDMIHGKDDHVPITATFQYALGLRTTKRTPTYDRDEVTKPENKGTIEEILRKVQTPPWHIPVEQHVQMVERDILRCLNKEFPKSSQRTAFHPYIGERLWRLVQNRKEIRKEIHMINKDMERELLEKAWKAWAKQRQETGRAHEKHLYKAVLTEQLAETSQNIKNATKKDKDQYLKQVLHELQDAFRINDTKMIYRKLKHFRPKTPKKRIKTPQPIPHMMDKEGTIDTHERWARAWHNYWAKLECADVLPWKEHLQKMQEGCKERLMTCTTTEMEKHMPTKRQVEQAIHKMKAGKAAGPDNIVAEVYKQAPRQASHIIHLIAAKQYIKGEMASGHRGGWACPLYKHKGPHNRFESCRSVVIQNQMAKVITKIWREQMAKDFNSYADSSQGGARKGNGPTSHILWLRLSQEIARLEKRTMACVFMDVESAFYRTIRQFITQMPKENHEALIQKLFSNFDMPPLQYDDIAESLHEVPALQEAGVSPALQRMVQLGFEQSWARIRNASTVLVPQTGTRPGDPCADLMFCFVVRRVIQKIQARMEQEQMSQQMKGLLAWVDDLVLTIHGTAEEVDAILPMVLTVMHDECMKLGLKPSLAQGKTEILIGYRGKDAPKHKRNREQDGNETISFQTENHGEQTTEVVEVAKYLGSALHDRGRISQDIVSATAQAYQALRPLRRQILANQDIPVAQRRRVLEALGLSKACYAVGTWTRWTKADTNLWWARVMKMYRMMLPWEGLQAKRMTDLEVLTSYGLTPPDVLAKCGRLRLFATTVHWADDEYLVPMRRLQELDSHTSWTKQILQHLAEFTGDPEMSFEEAVATFRDEGGPKRMNKIIKKYCKRNQHIMRQKVLIQQEAKSQADPPKAQETGWTCQTCDKYFASFTGFAVHQRTKHQRYAIASHFAPTSVCLCCMRKYHVRSRLVQHLQYGGTDCLQYLRDHVEPLPTDEVIRLNAEEARERREANQKGRRTKRQRATYREASPRSIDEVTGLWTEKWDDEKEGRFLEFCESAAERLGDAYDALPSEEANECFWELIRILVHELPDAISVIRWLETVQCDLDAKDPEPDVARKWRQEINAVRSTALEAWMPEL